MTEDQELELFTIKSKFFREIPHPKLILKAMYQVEKMVTIPVSSNVDAIDPGNDLISVLQRHSDQTYAIKLAISRAEKPEELYRALEMLYRWHSALINRLSSYLPTEYIVTDAGIKQSDPLDSYLILQFIRKGGLTENQISTYICNEIEAGEKLPVSVLTKACLQARKINTNDGSRTAS